MVVLTSVSPLALPPGWLARSEPEGLAALWALLTDPATAFIAWPIAGLVLAAMGWEIYKDTLGERKRARELELIAPGLGCRWRPNRRHVVDYPFELFGRAQRRWTRYHLEKRVSDGVPGLGDVELLMMEFGYRTDPSPNDKSSSTTYEYTVAIAQTGVDLPWLRIRPKGRGRSLFGAQRASNLSFEDVDFSKHYEVQASDSAAAYGVVGSAWMRLLGARPGWSVECSGPRILLARHGRPRARDYRELADLALALVAHLPRERVNAARGARGLAPVLDAGAAAPEARARLERVESGRRAVERGQVPCDFEAFRERRRA